MKRRAFTLIEAIVAIVVTAVAVPPMVWALREAGLGRVQPVMISRARWLIEERLEDIIADRYSPARGYDYIVNTNYADEGVVTGFEQFARQVRVVETGADLVSAGTGYKTVTVSVFWADAAGSDHELSIATVLTELE